MKTLKYLLVTIVLFCTITVTPISSVYAQCAMCSLNAENSTQNGNTQGKGLNDGILFLLVIPYLAAAGLGFLWYKKYRTVKSNKSQEKIL
ncbi:MULTISPECIES: hypothetical protein [Sphingobacterium]|uniref:Uncharacterized protein n=1 Tax=Sphingobacterium kitahiroshimense TaxID=470446 RepID=A0ABV0C177_9SPHI|nr:MULTISPECIES: hypothetical protein [unclassified Sphingobacterium]KKX50632.1 hypothetical protein L950_0209375 [Sphingobacterium sp. IITKGP-BTPF85]MBB2952538.1 heme/copper-type cytochrome/quinol oxidase subunit 2 [Sphingobacterium sp. JUb56]MCS3555916.1 heme/copper-type cytochrome/quinol oxidase subunit 2 [Sphingobacterium sp. JUb21]NJI76359.1 hypothetical protein [Sphingobacterium sp. B16(2022)]QQD11841.1 hypothetical protein JAZ75_14530 [Sphingobacterium sp. UDSM-2020]